jgi:hypothetical protein
MESLAEQHNKLDYRLGDIFPIVFTATINVNNLRDPLTSGIFKIPVNSRC